MKKILAAIMACTAMIGMLASCGGTSEPAEPADTESGEATYVWKMALNSTEGDNAYDTAAVFAEKIAELTDGAVQIDLYGGAQLGSTTEVLEGMSVGVADIMCESVGTLAPFTDLANIDIMPYTFSGYDHFMNVWNSDLGKEIKDTVGEAAGFKLLGATYRSPRIVTATQEMRTVDDFAGFKLRAPNLDGYINVWNWMGSAPMPMAVNETYTAIQQGTVNGQENPMVDSINYSFDEVCDYWIKTNHVYSCNVIIMDLNYFNGLPEDIQAAIAEAAEYAGQVVSEKALAAEADAEQYLIDEGKTVIEIDMDEFAAHFEGYAEAKYPQLADWVNRIIEADA